MKKLLIALHEFDYTDFSPDEWKIIDTAKIKTKTTRRVLSQIRAHRYDQVIIGSPNWSHQFKDFYVKVLLFLARGKSKKIIDNQGTHLTPSFANLILSTLLFTLEIPTTFLLYTYLRLKVKFLLKFPHLKPNTSNLKPNIAYLRTDFTHQTLAGGSVGHIAGVINAFHRTGHPIEVYSMEKPLCLDPAVPIHTISPNKFFNNISEMRENIYTLTFANRATSHFHRQKPNLIYQRYSAKNFSGVLLARKHRIPFILEYNGSEAWIAKNWGTPFIHQKFAEEVELLNLKAADLIVVVSDAMKEQVIAQGIPEEKILSHPNCIDPKKFHPEIDPNPLRTQLNLEDKTVVGFIGTFGPWHGINLLAKSIKPAISKNPNLHFLLIGDGALAPRVQEIIAHDKVQSHVTLTGLIPQDDAPQYLAACDILTSPTVPNSDGTKFFGSPTKLFEYMGMGKAIIASDLDQIGQILTHEKTALLTKPGDLNSLTEAILTLASSPDLRQKLGQAAHQEAITKYTWQKNIETVLSNLKPST